MLWSTLQSPLFVVLSVSSKLEKFTPSREYWHCTVIGFTGIESATYVILNSLSVRPVLGCSSLTLTFATGTWAYVW